MSVFSLTTVSCASEDEARRIARRLVEEGVAACVQVTAPVLSTYVWEEKLCESRETLLFIKSTAARRSDIESTIRAEHSYECPEILHLAIDGGSADYLSWVAERTTPR